MGHATGKKNNTADQPQKLIIRTDDEKTMQEVLKEGPRQDKKFSVLDNAGNLSLVFTTAAARAALEKKFPAVKFFNETTVSLPDTQVRIKKRGRNQ
jgi:hypothetical protein